MAKYKKILVAYDGSDSAKNALAIGAEMASRENCWIKVLAVVPSYDGDLELFGISNIKETINGPGRKLLTEARELAEKHGVSVLTNLEQGEPFKRIVKVADEENCDLIVMGRSGQSQLERELMGGVTARVIGHTQKHVLIVPEGARFDLSNIMVAADGSANSKSALDYACSLAIENESKLTAIKVVHVDEEMIALAPEYVRQMVEKSLEYMGELEEACSHNGVLCKTFVKEGEPHAEITKLADELDVSLIVMGTHGRKGLNRLLMGSVTERTIGYANCPVMVIR